MELPLPANKWRKIFSSNKYFSHYCLYRFAKRGSTVHLLDCGNRFDPFLITKALKRERINLDDALSHIMIARIFTIHQLEEKVSHLNSLPMNILMITDIDRLIKEASIPPSELDRTLKNISLHLSRLKFPTAITHENHIYMNPFARDEVIKWEEQLSLPLN